MAARAGAAHVSVAALALAQNTASAPPWIELIPAGAVVAGADGRRWTNPDPAGVVAASKVSASRPLPLDWEHATETRAPQGLPAPAAGWIDGLELREGAVWGRVAWTDEGRAHVAGRAYRFVSPVFTHTRDDNRILALRSVGLTNTPNLTLTALNRSELETHMDELGELRSILGLAADAPAQDVVAKVRELTTATASNRPDPARFVPMETFEAVTRELNARNQGMAEEQAERHVAETIGRGQLFPAMKDWALALCKTNRPAFDDFITRTGPKLYATFGPSVLTGRPPGSTTALSHIEQEIASRLGLTAAEMSGNKG